MKKIEVLFSPAEFQALTTRDLAGTTCVVFDVLRATSSIITALAHGAASVLPVATIEEALQEKARNPALLLAGERHGLRITSPLTGGLDFDFGNSPREFQTSALAGKSLAMTTTNGTLALNACRGAREVLVGGFLNMTCLAQHLRSGRVDDLLLVCSGTYAEASYEDLLGAGALAHSIWELFAEAHIADSAQIARHTYQAAKNDLLAAMNFACNARRLLANPELRHDVPFSLQSNLYPVLPYLTPAGHIQLTSPPNDLTADK